MKTRGCLLLPLLLICMLAPAFSAAAVPRTINYQGYLNDSGGIPLNGSASIKFSLYSSLSGGSELWTETHSSVAVSNGLYSVILGGVDPAGNPLSLPFDIPYYLGISAGTDPEMSPRQVLTSAPYAFRAAVTDSVPAGAVTTDKIAAGAVTPQKLANVCPQGDFLVKTPTGWGCFSTSCTPATEVCDGIDNNCNGQIDEGFKNQATGIYDQDTACGNCYTDCTTIYAKPNAYGTCNATGIPACVMNCNAGSYDLNGLPGDGCEFQLDATAVYVSGSDGLDDSTCGLGPASAGGGRHPCASITHGMTRALSLGRQKVLVAGGAYSENIQLSGGISLYGGYHPETWERNIAANWTAIYGNNTGGGHNKAVRAESITSATAFDGFAVYGQSASSGGLNSYAIYVLNSNSNLSITNNTVFAGNGGRGSLGSSGSYGTSGANGSSGSNWIDTGTKACSGRTGAGGAGGINACGGSVNGGAGASTACPGACTATAAGYTGYSVAGGGSGGTAGAGAYNWESNTGCSTVNTCSYSNMGGNGGNGSDGSNGASGLGCSSSSGTVTANEWSGSSGSSGTNGTPGGGGGGGGAGGGLDDNDGCSYNDMLGGAGGGGGAGGCNGKGGAGGTAGGGSFGLLVHFNPASASFPVITGNTITAAVGGDGGGAGFGGSGGSGGDGASGGSIGGTYSWALGTGGRGGQGGDGGHGGGGGGGCGGVAYGLYLSGATGTPNYKTTNTFTGTPTGGTGGAGGQSLGNSGTAGSNGAAGATNY